MARLFGYFGNQADRIRCALAVEREAVALGDGVRPDGWGVGSYQTGEVLLRKKPSESRQRVELTDLVRDLRTDCAVAHLRLATVGARTLENTHPFRYRQWLFAHTGSVPGFAGLRDEALAAVPDFLARSVRGETDSEVFFCMVLAAIHRTGRLDDPELDRWSVVAAVREVVAALDALSSGHGQAAATLNAIVTNGHAMVAVRRGLPMTWVRRVGVRDCPACRREPDIAGREPRRIDHEAYRYVLVASDHPDVANGWHEMPDSTAGVALAIDRSLDAQLAPLDA